MKYMTIKLQNAQQTPSRMNSETIPRHITIKLSKEKDKQQETNHHKGSSIEIWADYSSETLEATREWADLFKVLKSYMWQNCPSIVREKLNSQINKSWGSSWPLNLPAKNIQGSSARWNERTLDNNSNLYGKIKISLQVNTWAIIKASIIITMVCNCTFHFLQDLRE